MAKQPLGLALRAHADPPVLHVFKAADTAEVGNARSQQC